MMALMDVESAARGLVAAGQLARLSAQTQARMTEWDPDSVEPSLWANAAFRQIGRAIASKRNPIADKDLKRLFAEIERLLRSADENVSNAVATDLLEEIWRATHHSGFDFSTVNQHLGGEARRYLLRWDEFNRTTTPGLKAK